MAKKSFDSLYSSLVSFTKEPEEYIPSGSIILDGILSDGKGIPMGTFIELAANYGAGKTTIALHISRQFCSQGRRVIYVDTEAGLNQMQLNSFSLMQFVDKGLFIPAKLQTFSEIEQLLDQVVDDPDLSLIFIDSITAAIPQKVLDKPIEELNEPGLHSRAEAAFLQKFKYKFRNTKKTIFFLNQFRTKIAMGYGQQTTVGGAGGQALKHYVDISLTMRRVKNLERSVPGQDRPVPYGFISKIQSEKNRLVDPFIPMEIAIEFGKGVVNSQAYIQLLQSHKVIEYIPRRGWKVQFKGEERMVPKDDLSQFVRDNMAYFKEVANSLGGIRLCRESQVESSGDEVEESVEE